MILSDWINFSMKLVFIAKNRMISDWLQFSWTDTWISMKLLKILTTITFQRMMSSESLIFHHLMMSTCQWKTSFQKLKNKRLRTGSFKLTWIIKSTLHCQSDHVKNVEQKFTMLQSVVSNARVNRKFVYWQVYQ